MLKLKWTEVEPGRGESGTGLSVPVTDGSAGQLARAARGQRACAPIKIGPTVPKASRPAHLHACAFRPHRTATVLPRS